MKRNKIIWIVIVIIVVVIGYKLYVNKKAINKKANTSTIAETLQIPVMTDTVKLLSLNDRLKKTGNLVPYKEAVVYAVTSGNLEQVNFELGTRVSQGQLMGVTDTRKLKLDLQKAITNEQKLKGDLQTYSELLDGKATTQEKVNQLRLDYNDAQNQVDQIRKQLYDTKILAPISGIVIEKAVERGVFVNSGAKLATVVDLSKVKVQVFLTEAEVYQVKEKDEVKITADVYPDKTFSGSVTYISPQADATHSYLVEISFGNPSESELRSGTFVYANFSKKGVAPVLAIPREALLENTQNPTVYVVQNNKVIKRAVRTGKDVGSYVAILSGLAEGEIVVTSGQINLKDQSNITVSNTMIKQ